MRDPYEVAFNEFQRTIEALTRHLPPLRRASIQRQAAIVARQQWQTLRQQRAAPGRYSSALSHLAGSLARELDVRPVRPPRPRRDGQRPPD